MTISLYWRLAGSRTAASQTSEFLRTITEVSVQLVPIIKSGMNHPKEEAVQQQACLLLIFLVRKLIIAAFFCAITFIIIRVMLPTHFTLFIK